MNNASRRSPLGLFESALHAIVAVAARKLGRKAPSPPSVDDALDEVNDRFHAAYDEARGHAERDEPVLVVLADTLVVWRGDVRSEVTFTPPVFHLLKSVAHAPVAIFALLHPRGADPLDQATTARLSSLRRTLMASQESVTKAGVEPQAAATLFKVISASLRFVGRALERGRCDDDMLRTFAREIGPELLRITEEATRVQLVALDRHAASQVARMTDHERKAFQVVVTGDHQARSRSLGMQYFEKVFGEPQGTEHRVTYGEGITEAESAAKLVGTRRLDRAIAESFFADSKRLQRDVLGDAVEKLLRTFVSELEGKI